MSDSSIDMKPKSPCAVEFKANGGFSGSPLPNDDFVVGGRLAAKVSFRQHEIRGQKFCRQGWRPLVSLMVTVRSSRMPEKFPPMISNHSFAHICGQDLRHRFVIVRIYYREVRFVGGFAGILTVQFRVPVTQDSRRFMSDLSIDMKEKSQNTAATRPVARLDKLKPSASTVAAHKNLADATGHCGRNFSKTFCFILKLSLLKTS